MKALIGDILCKGILQPYGIIFGNLIQVLLHFIYQFNKNSLHARMLKKKTNKKRKNIL